MRSNGYRFSGGGPGGSRWTQSVGGLSWLVDSVGWWTQSVGGLSRGQSVSQSRSVSRGQSVEVDSVTESTAETESAEVHSAD
jgi:hypothetical protein